MSRIHEHWINTYLKYTDGTEAPSFFHLWTAIVTIAGAVQRKVWIDMAHFQWTCNFFVILVGEPGIVTKSTTTRIGRHLLRQGIKGYKQGPDSMTWQALLDALVDNQHSFKVEGGELVQAPLTLFPSELGNFLDPENREMLDLMTDMWDGQATTFVRRTRSGGEMEITCPWLSFISCTTPTWIQNNMSASMIGGGFASRMIVVFGEEKSGYIAYPGISSKETRTTNSEGDSFTVTKDAMPAGLRVDLEASLIDDLREIARLNGPMVLSPAAIKWGERWYRALHTDRGGQEISKRAAGYYARKQTHLHKIAMVFSISKRETLIIEEQDLIEADGILRLVEKHMMKVLANVTNRNSQQRNAAEILHILEGGLEVSEQDLFAHVWTYMGHKEYTTAVADLIAAKKVNISSKDGVSKLVISGKRK